MKSISHYSNTELLQLSNKTLTVLEREANAGCIHCIAILREIFKENVGQVDQATKQEVDQTDAERTAINAGEFRNCLKK